MFCLLINLPFPLPSRQDLLVPFSGIEFCCSRWFFDFLLGVTWSLSRKKCKLLKIFRYFNLPLKSDLETVFWFTDKLENVWCNFGGLKSLVSNYDLFFFWGGAIIYIPWHYLKLFSQSEVRWKRNDVIRSSYSTTEYKYAGLEGTLIWLILENKK